APNALHSIPLADFFSVSLGFTLDRVAKLPRLEDGTHCGEARGLAEHSQADVRTRLADLARMKAAQQV
ncbi:MAG: MerR family DNA-binding protein, partial [Anaerolineae bacterium]